MRKTDTQKAIAEIAAERKRQIEIEGFSPERDDRIFDGDGALAKAAAAYAWEAAARMTGIPYSYKPLMWPSSWGMVWWKPVNPRRDLIRAAALIVAEIERLNRARRFQ